MINSNAIAFGIYLMRGKKVMLDRDLAVLFALVIIRHGAARGDTAHAIDHAGAGQHGFAEHGFSRRRVAHDCEVTDVTRLILFHTRIWSVDLSAALVQLFVPASANGLTM